MNYAKLAQPRLHNALKRPRLFEQLDRMRAQHPVIWISSPPGAGKTTLAASYLAQAQAGAAWCQLDNGDSDAPTLFFFLNESVRHLLAEGSTAPQAGAQAPLEQAFFREFYARLAPGSVLVLDNVQEFDWDNAGALLEAAFNEVPAGINVFAISREVPPARLARLTLNGQVAMLGWNELRFDKPEALALAAQGEAGQADVEPWLDVLDGWAAGVVMLRSLRFEAQTAAGLDSRDAVFRYFAGEIFERMAPGDQRMLMLLAGAPGLSAADAAELTGSPDTGALLEQLFRNRLFVERRGDREQTYHFHMLFGEFLQLQARQRLDADERAAWRAKAGLIMARRGRIEEAAELYQQAGAHAALLDLMLGHAGTMLATGRGQTWREWMSALPAALVEAHPMLWYWHGVSLHSLAPLRARQILLKAVKAFRANGDAAALMLAITAMVDSYDLEWTELDALPTWLDEMQACLARLGPSGLDPVLDLRVHSRLVLGLLLTTPDAPALTAHAQQALRALAEVADPLEKLTAGAILLRYFDWADGPDVAKWLVTDLGRTADDPAISPFHRVWWYGRVARWYNKDGRLQEAEQTTGAARNIVTSFDLDPLLFQFLEVNHLLGAGDLGAARAALSAIQGTLDPTRRVDWLEFHTLEMRWHAQAGDIDGALKSALASNRLSAEAGLASTERARTEALLAALYALAGDEERTRHWYDLAEQHAFGHDVMLVREARQFVDAYLEARAGNENAAVDRLRGALSAHRLRQATHLFAQIPRLASALAALGFKHDVEVAHLRAIVARQNLAPPDGMHPNWPWPVAVRTLGKFELRMVGEEVVASGKAQQRPLMLLKALVAGGTLSKAQTGLCTQLWPDGDDPKSALNVTIHRLRKLLQGDDLVQVTAGTVQLPETKVWSDVGMLAELCNQVDGFAAGTAVATLLAAAGELLSIYRGAFCDGEEESWMIPVALRWRNRFVTATARLGQLLEDAGEWQTATSLYQRALEAEPLAEALHRGVMRCASARSDAGAALSAYRRCKDMLSIVAGRAPSPETESLAHRLGFKA